MSRTNLLSVIGKKKIKLNVNVYGNPIIDDNGILKGFNNNNYVYWKLEQPPSNYSSFELQTKIRINDLSQNNIVIFGIKPSTQGIKFSYNNDGSGAYGFSCLVGNNNDWINVYGTYLAPNVYTTASVWWWIKIRYEYSDNKLYLKKSTDGITYSNLFSTTCNSRPNFSNNTEEIIGYSSHIPDINSNKADIDLKEVKYYINNELSFKAVG